MMVPSISREFAKSLEQTEIAAFRDFYAAAPEKAARKLGVRLIDLEPMCLAVVPGLDILAFNRAVGYGLQDRIDPSDVDRYIEHFRSAGATRFFFQMCPVAAPLNARRELQARGLHWYNNWVKLYRDTSPPPPADQAFEIRLLGRPHALEFGKIVSSAFGWGEDTIDWVAALIGRPQWRVYGAFDGARLVAAGALYIDGSSGWLDFAATVESHRASGAQSGLLTKRINDAAALGIETLVVETAEQTAERSAPSFRNVQRFGFEVAYVRPNFLGKQ